ncbi:hypothetical protein CDAR_319681 [Caerostris darwini]|uniref:Uncharacterized protein n=1 Tax=Caerostris darwini TaxID=1538125 RepID=A0AAV4M7U6_9ARAC|nr:hypothetical protein CDAR_319681 [Caerostris darwini]
MMEPFAPRSNIQHVKSVVNALIEVGLLWCHTNLELDLSGVAYGRKLTPFTSASLPSGAQQVLIIHGPLRRSVDVQFSVIWLVARALTPK